MAQIIPVTKGKMNDCESRTMSPEKESRGEEERRDGGGKESERCGGVGNGLKSTSVLGGCIRCLERRG